MCGISVNTLHQKFGQGCTEPSALRSIGPQLPASSHLHVASRTELAEVLLLTAYPKGRKEVTAGENPQGSRTCSLRKQTALIVITGL